MTRETVEAALTPRTKAIVPVHLFGNVAPVAELRDLGVPVIEDAAQAVGGGLGGRRPARSATPPPSRSSRRRTSPASATAARS